MLSVFDVLGRDHLAVQRMLAELGTGPTQASGATATHLALREKMVEELIIEESKHEAAEEMYFWPVVRERLPNGDQLADHAIGQEQEGKEILDLLDKLDASQPEFEDVLSKFIKAGREHIAYEETVVWPPLSVALSAQDAADLGSKIEKAKQSAPTRPHPGTPAKPGVLKGAGPVVSAVDRLRDAASGRGKD
jgi:hemerythrin HHE cation binding domain-containing protein